MQVMSAMKDPQKCEILGLKGFEYVEQSLGATQKILQHAEIQSLLKK
jgi:hypothetical protein